MNKKINVNKNALTLMLIALIFVSPNGVHSQLDNLFGKKKATGDGGTTIDKSAFGESAEQAAESVLAARIAFLDAKAKMMEALGLKNEAVTKASEALQAKKGASDAGETVDAIKDSSEISEEANRQLAASMAQSAELSAESKIKFANGGSMFIQGVILEKEQIETIQKLVQQGQSMISSAGPLEKVGVLNLVGPVTSLSAMVPGDVKEATTTLSKILEFAKNQKIEIPNSADALEKLGSL